MNSKNKNYNTYSIRSLVAWILMAIFLVGIPAVLSFFAVNRYFTMDEQNSLFDYKMRHQQLINNAKQAKNEEDFFGRFFYENFAKLGSKNITVGPLITWMHNQKKAFDNEIDFIVWNSSGKIQDKTFETEYNEAEWKSVHDILLYYAPYFASNGIHYSKLRGRVDLDRSKKILGPQIIEDALVGTRDAVSFSLAWADSAMQKPPFAAYALENAMVLIFFNYDIFENFTSLKYIVKNSKKTYPDISVGIVDCRDNKKNLWVNNKSLDDIFDNTLIENFEKLKSDFVLDPDRYYGYSYISPEFRFITSVKRKYSDKIINLYSLFGAVIYGLVMLPFLFYTWRSIVYKIPGKFSIRLKLAFLFWFSTGIPLVAMIMISNEHNIHKRHMLISSAQNMTNDTLKSYDRKFRSFLKNICFDLDKFYKKWGEHVKKNGFDKQFNSDSMKYLIDNMYVDKSYVIGSETSYVGSSDGFIYYKGSIDNPVLDKEKSTFNRTLSKYAYDELKLLNLVAKKIIGDLNRKELPRHLVARLELVAESLLQLNFIEITNGLMTNVDDIKPWGFEKNINMTYFKFVPVHTPDKLDYALVCLWLRNRLQADFLKTSLFDANRNEHNIKLVVYNLATREFFGNIKDENDVLIDYVKKTGKSQSEEIEFIDYNGQDYVIVAFNGEYLNAYRLIGLYPIKNAEKIIGKQKTELTLYVLLNTVLAISLAQILAKSFLEPLSELQKGAIAIENRDFSHRITNLDKDEFGEVGNIFNNIMVGLAEVETAKVVQESLFPKESFFHNSFAVYGKSIAMSGIGGDYFDYFQINDKYFAALIGDVAGHGIGAALIMAMAKAGILCSEEYQNSPEKILNLLHQLILQSKNKQQRKIMTFQYVVFNSEEGKALYANAGGCSPYIYRKKTNEVEELKFASPVLGAFKKTVYTEKSFELEQGDAVIFYSDGIIESRNTAGEDLGYSQFQKIIADSYDINPALFYNNIYNKYKLHTENNDPEDDMTLVILVFNNNLVANEAEKDKNAKQII